MAKPTPLTDEGLKALVQNEMRQAIGTYGGKLSEQRRKAEYYYLGLPIGDLTPPEIPDRSTFVSTDVRNVIEAMLPQLMVKFVGGETVVEFEPTKPEDEDKAQSCTDYLNYLFFKKNNGHAVTYTWFKDALLQKRGIVKVWWDTRNEETREEYKGMTDVELAQVMEDPEVEPIDQKSYPDEEDARQREKAIEQMTAQLEQAMQAAQQGNPQAQQAVQQMQMQLQQLQSMPPKMLYDVSFKRVREGGKITVENVPPEEFLISRRAKTIDSASFVGHRVGRTLSELRSMGYKNVDNISGDNAEAQMSSERIERLSYDDEQAYLSVDNQAGDDSQRTVWVTECYVRCDYNGDGIAELRKVVMAGNEILDNEEVDGVPFVSICPIPMPHKFFGLSIADVTMESQKANTQIMRGIRDNQNLQVNGRYFAVENQVNLDDLLTSRPGGIVRVKQPNAVGRLDQGQADMSTSGFVLDWMDRFKEDSTGWTKYSQGNDSKGLTETAEGMNIITNKADMRTDLIARHFAEGFVDLFKIMLKLVGQNQNKRAQVRLSGKWVDIDPREWRNQFDVNINVGIGLGNRDQRARHMGMLMQHMGNMFQIGVATPENAYNASVQFAQDLGFKNPDKFFNDPKKNPPPPRPNPDQMKAETAMKLEQVKAQASLQTKQMELQFQQQADEAKRNYEAQLEQMKAQMQAEVDNNRQRSEAEQHSLKIQNEAQLAQLKAQYADQAHMREMEFNRWKAELEASVRIEVANISSKAKMNDAATATATNEIATEVKQ